MTNVTTPPRLSCSFSYIRSTPLTSPFGFDLVYLVYFVYLSCFVPWFISSLQLVKRANRQMKGRRMKGRRMKGRRMKGRRVKGQESEGEVKWRKGEMQRRKGRGEKGEGKMMKWRM